MKKITVTLLLTLICSFAYVQAQTTQPSQREILRACIKVNDYFMEKYADYTATSNVGRVRPSNIWTRGVYYEGLLALHTIFPREDYYKYAYDWGSFHKWGMRNGNTTRNADDHCCGQAYIDLYNMCPSNPEMIRNIKISMDMLVNTPQVNDWTWIDAIQMAMPILAKFGKMYGEQKYYDKMWDMYEYSRNTHGGKGLYNPEDALWWRDADFCPPYKEPNGEDCYWSRGNGWVYAALARVLQEIPADETHRNDYIADFLAMTKALKACQREDGFWNASLHDPTNFGGKETTGTSLFVYGMAWGINKGILNKEEYLPIITKAWNAMVKDAVHPNGFLGYVQGTGKEPKDGQPVTYTSVADFEDYGVGCFLLAGSEMYKLK
ncbi:glycoside hydrolase family 88 protein [Bacteroides sp. 214]|uniref:glycoside hydrolase family 88/105 protein n=1 Tax=Bacteroides sp. 214 TaxID=2302935 RepID=UPI0013D7C562|nr:glycoside hydrolase family 88 protein [Bacteroides sp. 214]NDW11445.1 glycoside hydrolase family 88 protein [Bacteroides sp. 214]